MYGLSDVIDFFYQLKKIEVSISLIFFSFSKNREKGQSIRLWTRHPCMYILGFGIHLRL